MVLWCFSSGPERRRTQYYARKGNPGRIYPFYDIVPNFFLLLLPLFLKSFRAPLIARRLPARLKNHFVTSGHSPLSLKVAGWAQSRSIAKGFLDYGVASARSWDVVQQRARAMDSLLPFVLRLVLWALFYMSYLSVLATGSMLQSRLENWSRWATSLRRTHPTATTKRKEAPITTEITRGGVRHRAMLMGRQVEAHLRTGAINRAEEGEAVQATRIKVQFRFLFLFGYGCSWGGTGEL